MNTNQEKQLLITAIDDYEAYTNGQKMILKILVSLSVEGLANVGTIYLMKQTNLSRASIYLNLKKFELEGIINKIRKPAERQNSYKLNLEKLDYIVQLYQNKKAMEND